MNINLNQIYCQFSASRNSQQFREFDLEIDKTLQLVEGEPYYMLCDVFGDLTLLDGRLKNTVEDSL
jgi:hypothetical protein